MGSRFTWIAPKPSARLVRPSASCSSARDGNSLLYNPFSSLIRRVLMEPHDRSKLVLATLVREYIAAGEPVASSVLVTAAGLGVSSATVRSILARLEHEGYVQQPHTSAGRIPTDRGYRFYVDLLLEVKRPNRTATAVEARLRRESPDRLLDSMLPQVSHVLSQASRQVGFALRPAHEAAVFD